MFEAHEHLCDQFAVIYSRGFFADQICSIFDFFFHLLLICIKIIQSLLDLSLLVFSNISSPETESIYFHFDPFSLKKDSNNVLCFSFSYSTSELVNSSIARFFQILSSIYFFNSFDESFSSNALIFPTDKDLFFDVYLFITYCSFFIIF